MSQPTVWVISGQPEFSRGITEQWHLEPSLPPLTMIGGDVCADLALQAVDLVLVGGFSADRLMPVLAVVEAASKPLVVMTPDEGCAHAVRSLHPRAIVLVEYQGSVSACVMIAAEVVKRFHTLTEAQLATDAAAKNEHHAILGRFILETRHTLNNALTSVLGNAELLLLGPETLTNGQRSQIETMRTMAGRIHEILQRLSSLDNERKWVEEQRSGSPLATIPVSPCSHPREWPRSKANAV